MADNDLPFWKKNWKSAIVGVVILVVIIVAVIWGNSEGFRPTRTDRDADSSEVVAEVAALNKAVARHFKQNPMATWK